MILNKKLNTTFSQCAYKMCSCANDVFYYTISVLCFSLDRNRGSLDTRRRAIFITLFLSISLSLYADTN